MSWDISAFPLQDPSFPTARPGLENPFPLSLSRSPSCSLPSSLSLVLCLCLWTPQRLVYRRTAQCKPSVFKSTKSKESLPSEKPLGGNMQAKVSELLLFILFFFPVAWMKSRIHRNKQTDKHTPLSCCPEGESESLVRSYFLKLWNYLECPPTQKTPIKNSNKFNDNLENSQTAFISSEFAWF